MQNTQISIYPKVQHFPNISLMKGYRFHKFLKDKLHGKSGSSNKTIGDGSSDDTQWHFKKGFLVMEEVHFCEEMDIPTIKQCKPDAVPVIFP